MLGYDLPIAIEVNNKNYSITNKGDYRVILDCFSVLSDDEILPQYRIIDCLKIFYEDINSDEDVNLFGANIKEAVSKMYDFFNCNQEQVGIKTNYKLIDWEQDAQLVCAAVNKVAQTEIRSEPYLHWWTFMGYYFSIGESVLSTVVSIRHKRITGKKLEKHEREFIKDNPQYFETKQTQKQKQEADDLFDKLWNKK